MGRRPGRDAVVLAQRPPTEVLEPRDPFAHRPDAGGVEEGKNFAVFTKLGCSWDHTFRTMSLEFGIYPVVHWEHLEML